MKSLKILSLARNNIKALNGIVNIFKNLNYFFINWIIQQCIIVVSKELNKLLFGIVDILWIIIVVYRISINNKRG